MNTNTSAAATAAATESTNPGLEKPVRNTFRQGDGFIEGTIRDLLGPSNSKLTINGNVATQVHLSSLLSMGLVTSVGKAVRAASVKGRKPDIIRIPTNNPAMKVVRR